jgi:hypothetical protein
LKVDEFQYEYVGQLNTYTEPKVVFGFSYF